MKKLGLIGRRRTGIHHSLLQKHRKRRERQGGKTLSAAYDHRKSELLRGHPHEQ